MRRLHRSAFVSAALALAAWACSDEYQEAPPPGGTIDAGFDAPRDAPPPVLEASVVPPALTLGPLAPIPRGESGTIALTIQRGSHQGPLVVAASGLPNGVSAPAATIAPGTSEGTLAIAVSDKAPEGAASIDVALLDDNEKLATASVVVEIAPLRSGTLDPDFGTNGFVDLGVPQALVAFASDGSLYVNAVTGLARWSKDGVRDPGYGPLAQANQHTFWAMTVADSGQVYFSGYESTSNSSVPIVVRTTADGSIYDSTFGTGGASLVKTVATAQYTNAIALAVLPTSIYAVVKVLDDGGGNKGAFTVARMTANGTADTAYGTNGFLTLGNAPNVDELAFIAGTGIDRFFVTAAHVDAGVPGYIVFEGANNALTARAIDEGYPTALAVDANGAFVARNFADAGPSIARVGDAGIDLHFDVATGVIRTLGVDDQRRALAAGCRGPAATWERHLADGGADPTYRGGTSAELSCIVATKTTDKYVYIAGTSAAAPGFLRVARLLR